jgi:excinuclease ABC subunit C
VDGGKGQLNAALKVVHELDLKLFDVIALAKGKRKGAKGTRTKHKTPEQIFIPYRKNPVILPCRSAALLLLERIRDESHRFALRYHKTLRHKENLHSSLQDIPGVGEKMRNRLLKHFGSVENVTKASVSELCQVPFVKQKVAEKIHRFFRAEKGNHEAHEEKPDARYMIKKS